MTCMYCWNHGILKFFNIKLFVFISIYTMYVIGRIIIKVLFLFKLSTIKTGRQTFHQWQPPCCYINHNKREIALTVNEKKNEKILCNMRINFDDTWTKTCYFLVIISMMYMLKAIYLQVKYWNDICNWNICIFTLIKMVIKEKIMVLIIMRQAQPV